MKVIDFSRRVKRKMEFLALLVRESGNSKYFMGGGTAVTNALLLCHSLEKGMGISNVKKGYGKEKAKKLINNLKNLDVSSFAYAESAATIQAYLEYQKEEGSHVEDIENALAGIIQDGMKYKCNAGVRVLGREEFLIGQKMEFDRFVNSKHSIRKYSFEPLKREDIEAAVAIARNAPSACNRQPCRFLYTTDDQKNCALSALIPGNKSFADEIPYYGLIVADRNYFASVEAFQWYVNGGIFITYLSLAFHSIGIGSCIFQWPDFYQTDSNARKLCGVKKSEVIIAAIGYGRYPNEAKCVVAQRKPVEDISSEF